MLDPTKTCGPVGNGIQHRNRVVTPLGYGAVYELAA